MELSGGSFEGLMCLLSTTVVPKELRVTTELDLGKPLEVPRIQVRPSEAGLAALLLGIAVILRPITWTEVSNSVVAGVTVDMVDFVRPFAMDVEPCEAVLVVFPVVDDDAAITGVCMGTGTFASFSTTAGLAVGEPTSLQVVVEQLFEPLDGEVSAHRSPTGSWDT